MRWTIAVLILACGSLWGQANSGFTKINTSVVTGITFTDAGCKNQNTCYYQVTAVDVSGHESPPAVCSATTLCFALNQAVATMPSSGTHTVGLTWIAATDPVVVGYNAYRSVGPLSPSGLGAIVAGIRIDGLLRWELS